ncbi:RimJ/RimL family protein N-acetyltransferase [Halanaerobium saccharolyticum]|uniref:RimJ/RimL family protein N-acetyltransferase n=1 Tax=Halanaerobium saccharolyticum TaxID=43595 RepID=A0A2T5RPQ2_9FIRM|nr:GNAT family protein [Halanaerobium saccharolyticum]PTW01770.1 RimJ/RimL family protein N-acetyltransferase [Halanaerobium saccharolyticum]
MIEGDKVFIRQLELGDEELLHRWRNNSQGNLYCGFKYGFLMSKESFRLQVETEIKNEDVFPPKKMFIFCKKEDLTPIGELSYRNWDKRNRSAEFGIENGEIKDRGKGYGFDALNNFIEFMFNFLNLNRIELTTLADNHKSQNLYKKLGFKKIGIMREASFDSREGTYSDVLYMDLLRKDWDLR